MTATEVAGALHPHSYKLGALCAFSVGKMLAKTQVQSADIAVRIKGADISKSSKTFHSLLLPVACCLLPIA